MDLHLTGKSIVITGGATGIGKAAALAFAREGAKVSICGRRAEKLQAAAEDAMQEGLHIDHYVCDITDTDALAVLASQVAAKNGGIDVWVNNAGIAINRPFMEYTKEDYYQIMRTNLDAVFFGSQIAANYMKERGGGVILNASSYTALIPHSDGSVYGASKAAISNLTKSMAANLAPWNIRVIAYIPGMIVSEISTDSIQKNEQHYVSNIAMHRLGKPEDLAKTLVFLASDAAGYISGVDIEIAGGKYAVQDCERPWRRLEEE